LGVLKRQLRLDHAWHSLETVNEHLFETYQLWYLPLDILALLLLNVLLLSPLLSSRSAPEGGGEQPSRLPVGLLGAFAAVLYVLAPDFPSLAVGFLKARLILLPPLLWLACLQMPGDTTLRRLVTTAGADQAGRHQALFVVPPTPHANPL